MRVLLLLLLPLCAYAGEDIAEKAKAEREAAEKLLATVYRSQETARFCTQNPEATYRTTVAKITFDVDCKTRNEWIEYAAKKE